MNNAVLTQLHNNPQFLGEATQQLVPWWSVGNKDFLKVHTEQNPKSHLDSYYLFSLDEISVNSECDNIPKFINERFQNILAAASHSGVSVALLLSCKSGKSRIFLGLKSESLTTNAPKLFASILNGILPGKNIEFDKAINISSLAEGCRYGGMVTGIPIIKSDGEKQKFNLSSVARSLYGNEYLLAIISKPVSEIEKQNAFNELIDIRDRLHVLAKRTVGEEKGSAKSLSETETSTKSNSNTKGHNVGVNAGRGFWCLMFGGAQYSYNYSNTENESISKGTSETLSKHQSRSLTVEHQNGIALELEKLADHYIERMIRGFSSGYWETSITFVTRDEIASNILAGTFAGELSKPGDKLLPPARIYLDTLNDQTLFIPTSNSSNTIFKKPLCSYITSEELSLISSPPVESVPGYEIQKMPALALTDTSNRSGMVLGHIADHGNPIHGAYLHLSRNDLNKHLFVCGLTGSGKTTTVKYILKNLVQNEGIPFLVIESAKRDYRQLLANDVFKTKELYIFTIGDATISPIRFNPFYIQEGVHPLVHIDYLKAIFNASFSLYGPMPSIVEKCLHAIYIQKGWDLTLGTHPNFVDSKGNYDGAQYQFEEHFYCFPTLADLKNEVDRYIKTELDYKGELRDNIRTAIIVRLESLCVGAKGLMFNTHDFFSIEHLLSKNTILEMESLADDDDKAFFVGLILVLMTEYRQKENPAVNPGMGTKGLRHFMVIEEAHRLLKNVVTERTTEMMGNPKGKAVEVFCNILSEMRSLGQGVAVVEQIPSKISPDVIKNSNTKIVHRLVAKDDQGLLAGSLSIDDYDALYLNRLRTGHALCHKEGMGRPIECIVSDDVKSHAISDQKVKNLMASLAPKSLHSYQSYQLDALLGEAGKELVIKFFNSLVTLQSDELDKLIGMAKDGMQTLLVLRDVQYRMDDSLFSDYFALQIMMLLNKGMYRRNNRLPGNLKSLLIETIKKPLTTNRNALNNRLNVLWHPISSVNFIEDIVENLAVQHCLTKSSTASQKEIESTVCSYLLFDEKYLIRRISQKVQRRMEGG
jgi:hypothetical protein